MATKITELPVAADVQTTDFLPLVDVSDSVTEKVTVRQIVESADGIVATLTGSNFSGPVTASLGLHTSYVGLGTSTIPTVGHVRLPINGTIYGLSGGAGDARLLRFNSSGAGYDLRIGESSLVGTIVLETTAAPGGGFSISGAGDERAFIGASTEDHIDFGILPATTGVLRLTDGTGIYSRDSGDTININLISHVGAAITVGDNTYGSSTQMQGASAFLFGTSNAGVYNTNGSGYAIVVGAGVVEIGHYDNVGFCFSGNAGSYGGGSGVVYLGNAATVPASDASNGSLIYSTDNNFTIATTGGVVLAHSGSTVRAYDSRLTVWEFPIVGQTTNATPTTLFTFPSGSDGRNYAVNYRLQAQSTTTTGSIQLNGYGHFERSGGTMTLRANSSTVVWRAASTMSGSLGVSTGDIVVIGTGLAAETYNWRGFVSVQECG